MLPTFRKEYKPNEKPSALSAAYRPLAVRTAVHAGKDCTECAYCMLFCAGKSDCGVCRQYCAGSPLAPSGQ